MRPPFGVVVLGDGSRVEVQNTELLRSKVLAIAEQIRESRKTIREEIPVRQPSREVPGVRPKQKMRTENLDVGAVK